MIDAIPKVKPIEERVPIVRKDLENRAYARWLLGEPETQEAETELRALLKGHAQAVIYSILRRRDVDLMETAVDQVLLKLPTFKGQCLFTTWAHKVITGLVYDQRKLARRHKEVSLNAPEFDFPDLLASNAIDLRLTIEKLLVPNDMVYFKKLVYEGYSQAEVAQQLEVSQQTVSRVWKSIVRILKHAFAK